MPKHKIVIVGGGAGGLELATLLGDNAKTRQVAEITLIDANMTHIWKPRLHEIAAGALNADIDELSYVAHAKNHAFNFMLGRMSEVDRDNKKLILEPYKEGEETILPQRHIDYDTLVIAIGSQTNDFGTKGVADNCIFLDKRLEAERFHRQFLNEYLRHAVKSNSDDSLNIAIVGAGATGVELAAELHHSAHELMYYGFGQLKPENLKISIIEGADRVLPVLSPKTSSAILSQLKTLKIEVLTGEIVSEATSEGLHTQSGKFIPAQLKVWSAGVKAPEILRNISGLETNRINQLVVHDTLQSTHDENIFAFGDCAQCPRPDSDRPVPPRAQSAHQQALLLSESLKNRLTGKELLSYVYKDKGSLISLSKTGSIGNIMGNLSKDFTFGGKVARLMYISLYRMHQITLHGYFKTLLIILRDLVNKKTGPKLKLH